MQRWEPGTQIRWIYGDGFVDPMTVVRDDDQGLVAWLRAGTPTRRSVRADGRPLRADLATMFTAERKEVDAVWKDHDVLRIAPTNAWWSVWVFFDATTHAFEGWYVNIEDPLTRGPHEVRTRDHVLDLWVEPDRTRSRKDEDELELAVQQGRYNSDEAELITGVAEQAEQVIDAWGSPFCDGWEHFTPDPAWPVPTLD
jgi:hypothetical protein